MTMLPCSTRAGLMASTFYIPSAQVGTYRFVLKQTVGWAKVAISTGMTQLPCAVRLVSELTQSKLTQPHLEGVFRFAKECIIKNKASNGKYLTGADVGNSEDIRILSYVWTSVCLQLSLTEHGESLSRPIKWGFEVTRQSESVHLKNRTPNTNSKSLSGSIIYYVHWHCCKTICSLLSKDQQAVVI